MRNDDNQSAGYQIESKLILSGDIESNPGPFYGM